MSKLIVDEIQKNGGDSLTLPSTDATANNQALVGSSAGVLSFSPLAMPAADGAANKPVTTDGSGTLQFGATALPAADGTNGQVLTTNGSGVATWGGVSAPTVPSDNDLAIGALFSHANRDNIYSTGSWGTGGPDSTYNNELDDASDLVAAWNMLMGDGMPTSTGGASGDKTFSGNWGVNRYKLFAHNRRLGYNYRYFYWHPNGTSYPGCTFMCIPIRNTSAASIDVVLETTNGSQGNYAGTGKAYYTPTFSSGTNYANANGGSWTTCHSYQGDDETYDYQATVPVPANTTVLFMMTASWKYRTSYQFFDTCLLRSIHTTFSNADIVCDLRMLETLFMGRQVSATYNTALPYELYTTCATLMGDR